MIFFSLLLLSKKIKPSRFLVSDREQSAPALTLATPLVQNMQNWGKGCFVEHACLQNTRHDGQRTERKNMKNAYLRVDIIFLKGL